MRYYAPPSDTFVTPSIWDAIPPYPEPPTPRHPDGPRGWRTPDPKVLPSSRTHALRRFLVRTTLWETLFLGHVALAVLFLSLFSNMVPLGRGRNPVTRYCGVATLLLRRGWRLPLPLVVCSRVLLFCELYAVFVGVLGVYYAMCQLAQVHMGGVARRRPGWAAMEWFWDWYVVYRAQEVGGGRD